MDTQKVKDEIKQIESQKEKKTGEQKPFEAVQQENLQNQKEAEFDAELEVLMADDTSGKKKERKKWSKKKKIILIGVAAAVVILMAFRVMGSGKTPVTMVPTMPLAKGDIVENLTVSGPVSGTDSVDVVSNLHVEVLEILVKEGDQVEKGQLLAVLDSSDKQKEVEIAQNAYDSAVATYHEKEREAVNGYAKAVQDNQAAKTNCERTNALFQSGGVSQLELETAQNTLNDTQRQMNTYTLKNGKPVANEAFAMEIKTAEFTLEQKKKALENTQVTSPIAGTVVRVNSKVGRFADKTDVDEKPMFVIENLDVLEMKINVSEFSIGKISVGQKVMIRADILGDDIVNGEITAISPTGEEKGNGSTERIIPTTIRIVDKNTKLIAGITAKAEILLAEAKDVFYVPVSALLQKEDGFYIAALKEGKIRLIGVETGVESDIQAEVTAKEGFSLEENLEIVVTPGAELMDGMAATAVPSAS